jgi:outer membrane receptor protein involved in Fe transport
MHRGELIRIGCVALISCFAWASLDAAEADHETVAFDDIPTESELLPPMTIMAPRFKPTMTPAEKYMLSMVLRFGDLQWSFNHATVLTPERVPQGAKNSVYAVNVFEKKSLAATPHTSAVSALQSALGFGSSRSDHRERSGGALNGLRLRVHLDRSSVNNPFDGSIHWDDLPNFGLARAELVPGGGSSAWGEAPAGVIQLFTVPAMPRVVIDSDAPVNPDPQYAEQPRQTVHRTGLLAAELGAFGTRRLEFTHTEPTNAGMLQVLGRISATDGFVSTVKEQRGSIDRPNWNRHRWLMTRWRQLLGQRAEVIATVKGSEASRGLGTPDQREHDRARFASVEFSGRTADGFVWNAIVSAEHRGSGRTFSVVDDERSFETPALDQFAEPVTSYAAAFTATWFGWNDSRTNFGGDVRRTAGEAQSRSAFSDGAFAGEATAGGEQVTAGIFVLHHRRLAAGLRGMVGARVDAWEQTDGFVRNVNLLSGAEIGSERTPDLSGVEFSPSVGVVWEPRKHWRVRAAGQGSFRQPTLAERYRTFGDVNRVILENPKLKAEHSRGAEMTIEYVPSQELTFAARFFVNEIEDPVGTRWTTVGLEEPGAVDSPAGTVQYRKRVNFDRVRVGGTDLSVRYARSKQLFLEAGIRLQDSTLSGDGRAGSGAAYDAPGVPDRVVFAGVSWRPSARILIRGGVRWLGREFANEENTVRFGDVVVLDCGASYQLTSAVEVYLRADNIRDAVVEVERGVDGTQYRTTPRMLLGGVRVLW